MMVIVPVHKPEIDPGLFFLIVFLAVCFLVIPWLTLKG